MSELPAPMTPAECDLRGFEWMALHGHRLFTSGWYLAATKDPRGGIAALKLWWTAMLQCPAGSLPSDEDELCLLADFGQDIRAWKKHRAVAMRGFVLCSDHRYYHPMVAEQAIRAWECRQRSRHERDGSAERMRRMRERANGSHSPQRPNGRTVPEPDDVTRNKAATERVTEASRCADVARPVTSRALDSTVTGTEQEKDKKESNYNHLLTTSPVLARGGAACEAPPAGTFGAPLEETASTPAIQLAVKTIVGKVGRSLESRASVPTGRAPKLTVVEQRDAIVRGPVLDDYGQEPVHRGPCEPQRTVEEQLAWIRAEMAREEAHA